MLVLVLVAVWLRASASAGARGVVLFSPSSPLLSLWLLAIWCGVLLMRCRLAVRPIWCGTAGALVLPGTVLIRWCGELALRARMETAAHLTGVLSG